MEKIMQRIFLCLLAVIFLAMAGCAGKQNDEIISNSSQEQKENPNENETQTEEEKKEEEDKQEAFEKSTPENDTDVGLKNVKIDSAEKDLTEEQKLVISYFDTDHFPSPGLEFLKRYPQVFDNSLISYPFGQIMKIISQTADEYVQIYSPLQYGSIENAVIIKGKTGKTLFLEGDSLSVKGRYQGVETVEIDGKSYTMPVIHVHEAYLGFADRFNDMEIKKVARTIFGDSVEVRKEEVPDNPYMQYQYVAELENQSNAKFSKYYLNNWGGVITDASSAEIERHVEFSADFKHFFLFSYDKSMETMTLEYYDQEFNKIWKREFEEVTFDENTNSGTAIYDFTKNNVYCLVNNELYIINTETGVDTYPPKYVGEKIEVRKLSDGILLVSTNKSDGIMKLSLDGNIIWKTNTSGDMSAAYAVQIVGDNIVIQVVMHDKDTNSNSEHYVVVDNKTGATVIDAEKK